MAAAILALAGCTRERPAETVHPLPVASARATSAPAQTAPPPETPKPAVDGDASDPSLEAAAVYATFWVFYGTGKADPSLGAPLAWHRHTATGTCMPDGLGDFAFKNEIVTSPDDVGVSMLSRPDATVLSFFTYPAKRSLDDEIKSVTHAMCTGAAALSMRMTDPRFRDPGFVAACSHDMRLGHAVDQALVFQRGPWFFEARFTFLGGGSASAYLHAMAVAQTAFRPCATP